MFAMPFEAQKGAAFGASPGPGRASAEEAEWYVRLLVAIALLAGWRPQRDCFYEDP